MGKLMYVVLFVVFGLTGIAQPLGWQPPISGQVLLSGTFGELRGSHYHAGIDIKPNVGGPQEILAVADGFVKEILVRSSSYGNALILQHADGFKSLYGHLDRFNPTLDSLVYAHQHLQQSFEVSIELDSTQYPVTQGMFIGVMGNTGFSFGRHLHLEVRHESGTRYNPLWVLPDLEDKTPPQFRNLKINYHDDFGREYQEKNISVRALGRGRYDAGNLTLNAFKYSLGVDVIDLHENTHNRNGIHSLSMYKDSILVFRTVFDSLTTSDRLYYKEHIDHITDGTSNAVYHNLRYSSNSITTQLSNNQAGLFKPRPFQNQQYRVEARDYQGNTSTLTFSIRQVDQPSIDYEWMYNYVVKAGRSTRINLDQFSIIFPARSFVRDQRLYLFEEVTVKDGEDMVMIHMNEPQVPLYENATLLLRSDIPLADKEKWTLARCSGTRYTAIPTQREQNQFVALIRNLTDYCLIKDTLPPIIEFHPQNSRLWYFKVTDNLHSFSALQYTAMIDGKWALVKSDDKNQRLIFDDFQNYNNRSSHQFELTVFDGCGNKTTFKREFK